MVQHMPESAVQRGNTMALSCSVTVRRHRFSEVLTAPAVNNYHCLVRRLLAAGESPQDFTRRLIERNPEAVVLTDDIGSGIVPVDREERLWREECGICMRLLAAHAGTVIRVVCGIPQVLKGELP